MAFYGWDPDFLARWATKVAQAEKKFTNEQLEYLRQFYMANKYALPTELKAIASQWNIDDFDFFMSIEDWYAGQCIAAAVIEERRYQGRIAAA